MRKKERMEKKAFRLQVKKETTSAMRKSFREEAVKRAREEGLRKARKPKFGEQLRKGVFKATRSLTKPRKVVYSKSKKPMTFDDLF